MEQDVFDKIKTKQYYLIIVVISIFTLFGLPMLGSTAGLAWNLPTTPAGWVVFVVTKLLVAAVNILITHCFIQQGKLNIEKDPAYLEALVKYNKVAKEKKLKARSPHQFYAEIYGKKSVGIFLSSLVSSFALTQAVLMFDWITMITYFLTISTGIIWGILQMKKVETFWTTEFVRYVAEREEDQALPPAQENEQGGETAQGENI